MGNKQSRQRKILLHGLWIEKSRCHFCECETIIMKIKDGIAPPHNLAVLYHEYTKFEHERHMGHPGELRSILCCKRCADEQSAAKQALLPREELQALNNTTSEIVEKIAEIQAYEFSIAEHPGIVLFVHEGSNNEYGALHNEIKSVSHWILDGDQCGCNNTKNWGKSIDIEYPRFKIPTEKGAR